MLGSDDGNISEMRSHLISVGLGEPWTLVEFPFVQNLGLFERSN